MKGFDAGIVIAISLAAHACLHVVLFQTFTVICGGILRSPIRVMEETLFRGLRLVGVVQCVQNQIGRHSLP
ncbi:hypothetical protein D3C75_990690 [compost metagenome]